MTKWNNGNKPLGAYIRDTGGALKGSVNVKGKMLTLKVHTLYSARHRTPKYKRK